jgi:hypothetical protein
MADLLVLCLGWWFVPNINKEVRFVHKKEARRADIFVSRQDFPADSEPHVRCDVRIASAGAHSWLFADANRLSVRFAWLAYAIRGLSRVVGYTETGLNRNTILESTMDNLLLQSIQDVAGSPLAFSNGWRCGAPVPPGPVTINDLYNIIPMDPPVSAIELTGEELKQMMEENLERTFSRDPYQQMGGYVKRCLGLRMYFKIENPPGHRIQELLVLEERVNPDRAYAAVFVTAQGVPEKFGTKRRHLDINAVQAMRQYLQKKGTVCTSLQGSVVVV